MLLSYDVTTFKWNRAYESRTSARQNSCLSNFKLIHIIPICFANQAFARLGLRCIHTSQQLGCITDISIIIYHSLCNALHLQFTFVEVLQHSSQCRDGNMRTATHCNADAVEYEQSFTLCPALRLDVMSHAVDCVLQASNHTTRVFCRDSIYYTHV